MFDNVDCTEKYESLSNSILLNVDDYAKAFSNAAPFLKLLKENIEEGLFVAGGSCITLVDPNHPYDDIDIFTTSKLSNKKVVDLLKAFGFIHHDSSHFIKVYTDGFNKVQVIDTDKKIKNLEELLSTFDFDICKIGFDNKDVIVGANTVNYIKTKKITLNVESINRVNCASTVERIIKYRTKGYNYSSEHLIEDILYKYGQDLYGQMLSQTQAAIPLNNGWEIK
jgi:hypothetical protein